MSGFLNSWNDGEAKRAIIDFVSRVSDGNGPDFVPKVDRIATFDNDGTLWCEQPIQVQLFFAFDRLAEMAKADPSLKDRPPFKAFLERDLAAIKALGKEGAFRFVLTTHSGETPENFDRLSHAWLASAQHPKLRRRFIDNVYLPQLELLDFLRAHEFTVFIVTGGGGDFVRSVSEEIYGIPRHQVIGSSVKTRFEIDEGRADMVKLAELGSFDDREVKPANIHLHIGRRPILAFGNSDGDLAMLRYTKSSSYPSLALLLHHDDAEREYAYDGNFALSPLVEALDRAHEYGLTVVSMERDWNRIFGDQPG
ncbi:HAD family hydrolase [Aquamicrobium terrae]|uniref:Phosphoserine phosphatase n=1 Tax=Aquamicrobium terrae TaxID=1324945 RepID=A0ABV2N620_9HYPH